MIMFQLKKGEADKMKADSTSKKIAIHQVYEDIDPPKSSSRRGIRSRIQLREMLDASESSRSGDQVHESRHLRRERPNVDAGQAGFPRKETSLQRPAHYIQSRIGCSPSPPAMALAYSGMLRRRSLHRANQALSLQPGHIDLITDGQNVHIGSDTQMLPSFQRSLASQSNMILGYRVITLAN